MYLLFLFSLLYMVYSYIIILYIDKEISLKKDDNDEKIIAFCDFHDQFYLFNILFASHF